MEYLKVNTQRTKSVTHSLESVVLVYNPVTPNCVVYQYPSHARPNFCLDFPVQQLHLLNYPKCKGVVDLLVEGLVLVILTPVLTDTVLVHLMKETKFWVEACLVREIEAEGTAKPKRDLKNQEELAEALENILNPLLESLFFRLNPLFLYEDERFECSSIVHSELCLPLVFGVPVLKFPLSDELSIEFEGVLSVFYGEIVVPVHEILTLDPPSGIICNVFITYKGYVIGGNASEAEFRAAMQLYYSCKLYTRTNSFPLFTSHYKLNIENTPKVIGIIASRASIVFVILTVMTNKVTDFDPWLLKRGVTVAKVIDENQLLARVEQEMQKKAFRHEVFKSKEATGRSPALLSSVHRKSKSVASSPIVSPRYPSLHKIHSVNPVYYSNYNISLFHYIILDLKNCSMKCPIVSGSSEWHMGILRPLYVYYSQLFAIIQAERAKDFYEFDVEFPVLLPKEIVAVKRINKILFFCVYRGDSKYLSQLAYDLAIN